MCEVVAALFLTCLEKSEATFISGTHTVAGYEPLPQPSPLAGNTGLPGATHTPHHTVGRLISDKTSQVLVLEPLNLFVQKLVLINHCTCHLTLSSIMVTLTVSHACCYCKTL